VAAAVDTVVDNPHPLLQDRTLIPPAYRRGHNPVLPQKWLLATGPSSSEVMSLLQEQLLPAMTLQGLKRPGSLASNEGPSAESFPRDSAEGNLVV
jgi:hypothetical protein